MPVASEDRIGRIALALWASACSVALGALAGSHARAENPAKNASAPTYIGVALCKPCHYAKNAGSQFTIWSQSPHAKAWETLASSKAKEVAKAKGIDDPQKTDACLRCHVAGLGEPKERFGPKFKVEDGVQCESCHRAGSEYSPREVMLDHSLSIAKGLLIGDEALCRTCHNPESPTYKEFHFDEFWKRIAHPIPEERKRANSTREEPDPGAPPQPSKGDR